MASRRQPTGQDRGDYIREQRERDRRSQKKQSLAEWVDDGHKAIADADWQHVAQITATVLLPAAGVTNRSVVPGDPARGDLEYHPRALRLFLRRRREGRGGTLRRSGELVKKAFRSAYTLCILQGLVDGDATTEVPAFEYVHQVGQRYYSATSKGRDAVDMIDPDGDLKATLFTGGQGSGKSTALETVAEDRLANGHKLIDLMDMLKAENVTYDIESRDDDLRDARADMGLDVGFGDEYEPPNLEIRVPLTQDLADRRLPYDTGRDEFVVKPFVVPASELTYRQLVMVLPHITKTHENHLQAAHQMLSGRDIDWTLEDMAQCVREETNAGDTVADRIERSLRTAQEKSFIRDEQADEEYILDWPDMMADSDTITSFTFSPLEERSDRLLMASYLLDSLYQERRKLLQRMALHEFPVLTVAMRELHEIVPRQKSQQDAESTIEGYMIDTMSELIALVRHANMELLCDTQKFHQQLSPDVSGLFHRIFAFGGQRPDIKKVFSTRIGSSTASQHAPSVAKYDAGKCALVSGDGYRMPIQFAPPRCHHLDAKRDGNGLGFRVRHVDNEELRDAPWNGDIPPRLKFDDTPDSPVAEFWHKYVDESDDPDAVLLKDDVTMNYHRWSKLAGHPAKSHNEIHTYISRHMDVEAGVTRRHDYDQREKTCYKRVKLTW